MRKVIVSINTTADGYVSGPAGDEDNLEWATPNIDGATPDVQDLIDDVDTILLGRATYQGFAGYWPTQTGELADRLNTTPKIVFSRGGLTEVPWGDFGNARLIDRDVEAEVARLKEQPGKDMVTFGSPNLVQSFTAAGLVDQFRLIVHPVFLGSGIRLFGELDKARPLRLVEAKPYPAGAVSTIYDVT
jgi:dihydrofolate reductase